VAYSVLMERMLRRITGFVLVLACLLAASAVLADARTDFLVRMLATSSQFRVRAQAALALGTQVAEPGIVNALVSALRDEHPAVRAASAAALERLKDASAIPALKAAQSDRDGAVRTAVRSALQTLGPGSAPSREPARTASSTPGEPTGTGNATFYVGVAVPGSQVGLSKEALRSLREHLAQQVAQISGVLLAPENEPHKVAERVISAQKLVGYYLDSSVTSIDLKPDGSVRAAVSVVVNTYPGRDIRVMLSGAATLSGGGSGEDAKVQAIQAAYQGALRRLPQAMQAGLASAP
jgi:hypothetical protein